MVSASIETVKTAADRSQSSLIYLSAYVESPVIKIPLNSQSREAFKVFLFVLAPLSVSISINLSVSHTLSLSVSSPNICTMYMTHPTGKSG